MKLLKWSYLLVIYFGASSLFALPITKKIESLETQKKSLEKKLSEVSKKGVSHKRLKKKAIKSEINSLKKEIKEVKLEKRKTEFPVYVKALTGRSYAFYLNPGDDLGILIGKVAREMRLPKNKIRLIKNCRSLTIREEKNLVENYGIREDSKFSLLIRFI